MAILSELTEAWSASNDLIWSIPDEILALSFTFLPFSDRISASHVSQRWRRIALAHPAIWAHLHFIGVTPPKKLKLIRMALSRSGCHPVDLDLIIHTDRSGILEECLRHHMHHIRTVDGDLPRGSFPLSLCAPSLETLTGLDYHVDLPNDFLGGKCGRLCTLRSRSISLPTTCPALSTVQSLILDGPVNPESAQTFRRLFCLFPNLRSLCLDDLQHDFVNFLPQGPAPASLASLTLESFNPNYDVTPHYNAWRTDNLRDVSLRHDPHVAAHLDQLFSGAIRLTVAIDSFLDSIDVVADCPGGRTHSISFSDAEEVALTARLVLSVASALQHVRALEVPLPALKAFMGVCVALPALTHLTIPVVAEEQLPASDDAAHVIPWHLLRTLDALAQCRPSMDTITLAVECYGLRCPLTAKDARGLLAQLSALDGLELPDIEVQGFPQELICDVDIPDFDDFATERVSHSYVRESGARSTTIGGRESRAVPDRSEIKPHGRGMGLNPQLSCLTVDGGTQESLTSTLVIKGYDPSTSITAYGPGADRVRSVTFYPDDDDADPPAAALARRFLDAPPDNLRAVHALQLPFPDLAALLAVFPGLRRLGVLFEVQQHPWSALAKLLRAKELCPAIQAIELHVEHRNYGPARNRVPLTSDDLRRLLAQLAAPGRDGLTGVSVKGFSREIVVQADISAVAAFAVSFHTP
ncbi:hypothetical protein AURDEDRAFT_128106 [Auricularia subglabra TFB-10046 SS5]|uniref:F-box domain-containing protein n=1 Tax=Auricularia subglabra (strain TFB-10046 / SS5) TaxID=717982 RepID=J0D1Q9_AURST|nr:hypothetical protein AURDEDRAFT_128106 [Auricularia subglabra TFB-10046 SS5]